MFRCWPPRWLLPAALALLPGCWRPGPADRRGADGHLEIHFWNGFTGPDGKTMESLVGRFRRENSDLRVRMQIIPWGTYYDKLTLALAYDEAPDLFILHANRLSEYASFGVLRPLQDLYANPLPGTRPPALRAADFALVPWAATFFAGRQYGLPLDVHPLGLYYNTRLFREAGIVGPDGRARPPETWSEFLDAARRITRDLDGDRRPDQWGFVFTWQRSNWLTFAAQFGAEILSPDSRACALESAASLAALQRMRSLIFDYGVAPKPEGVDAWLAFRQGKVGMALEGIYQLASLEEQRGLPYDAAPAPRFGPREGVWAGSHLLCQPAGIAPERSRATWRLMRFLSDNSLEWARGGQIPVRLAILRSREFSALRAQSQFARQLPYVRYEPNVSRINALFPAIDPVPEAVLLGLQTPEEATAEACRRVNQILSRP